MWRRVGRRLAAAALLTVLSPAAAFAGDHPPATVPEPLGSASHRLFAMQVERADQDHFVLYENEWKGDSTDLGPSGRLHLDRIIRKLPLTKYPVVIQIHPDDTVNAARRRQVVSWLLKAGIADADARVLVGPPQAEGLYGEEAVMIYPAMITVRMWNNMMGRMGMGGFGMGGMGMGGFGMGGMGMGGFGMGGMGMGGYGMGGYGMGGYGMGGYGMGGYGATGPVSGYRGLGY
ncbi:MAG: hypothetical protein U0736_28010 [Gemmataceae bacterium]